MKKIFAYILAVAAFVGCATDEVVTSTTTLTAPMEVSVAQSRVFDADLNWSWENSDMILAYQKAGNSTINILSLNDEGNFYTPAFEYATDDAASFHFIYPMSSLSMSGLTVEQTGKWSPVLYGVAENTIISQIGTVEMNYLSSAFEVRVWANGRAVRKNITKAVITSNNDFVPYWDMATYAQTLSGKELSLDLNGDTAIFNLGEGDFAFTLTLTDAEGETLSWELPAKNFVAGKRTILNVEWSTVNIVEASVTSWYEDYATNNGTTLEGGAIYVNAVGGTPVVTVDGVEMAVVDGKILGVASGLHNVVVTINGQECVNRSVAVTSIPSVNATVRTSYSSNGAVSKSNSIDGKELQFTASLSDSAIPSSLVASCQAVYGSNAANLTLGSTSKLSVAVGEYNCYAKVTLGNGYTATSAAYTTHVTGLPCSYAFYNNGETDLNAAKSAGWSFSKDNTMSDQLALWNNSEAIVVGSPKFHAPANISTTTTLGHRIYKAGFTSSKYSAYVGASSSPTSAVKTNTYTISTTNNTGETASLNTHKGNDTDVVLTSSAPYITVTAETESSITVTYHYLHTIKIEYR